MAVALMTFATEFEGVTVVIAEGVELADDHVLVKRSPGMFTVSGKRSRPVEQATAVPGESRTTGRKRS